MTVEMLEQRYGHHHPDFQRDAAAVVAGSAGQDAGQKHREQNETNALRTSTKIADIFKERRWNTVFGTRGSQVQILPLRPFFPKINQAIVASDLKRPALAGSDIRDRFNPVCALARAP